MVKPAHIRHSFIATASISLLHTGCALLNPTPAADHQRQPSTRPAPRVEVVDDQPPAGAELQAPMPTQTDATVSPVEAWASKLAKQREARAERPAPELTPIEPMALTGQPPSSADQAARMQGSSAPADVTIKPAQGEASQTPVQPFEPAPSDATEPVAPPRRAVPAETIPGLRKPGSEPANPAPAKANTPAQPAPGQTILVNPGPTVAAAAATTPDVGVNQPSDAGQAAAGLRDILDQWKQQPPDTSLRQQLDRRLIAVLAGEYDQARQPLDLAGRPHQELVTRFIESIITLRQAGGGAPNEELGGVMRQIDQLRESLTPATDLTISTLEICKAVRGFGQYESLDSARLVVGRENEFVVYCELRDFVSEKRDDGMYHSAFGLKITILNRNGDTVAEQTIENLADRCRTRRHDCFLSPIAKLPSSLSAGEYVVKATVTDKIGKKVAERLVTVRLGQGG